MALESLLSHFLFAIVSLHLNLLTLQLKLPEPPTGFSTTSFLCFGLKDLLQSMVYLRVTKRKNRVQSIFVSTLIKKNWDSPWTFLIRILLWGGICFQNAAKRKLKLYVIKQYVMLY